MDTTTALLMTAAAFAVGLCLGRMGRGQPGSLATPAPIDAKALELAKAVLPAEGKIGAIKVYREATGVGLRDAKLAVDSLDDRVK